MPTPCRIARTEPALGNFVGTPPMPATRLWIASTEALLWLYSRCERLRAAWPEMLVPAKRDKPIYHAGCKLGLRVNLGYGLARRIRLSYGVRPSN